MQALLRWINFPRFVLIIGGISLIFYIFSFLFPITDNAFVVANIRPVAADVSGYVTHINVTNGQKVKKGDPLFTVFQKPYQLTYDAAVADVKIATQEYKSLQDTLAQDQATRDALIQTHAKLVNDYEGYRNAYKANAVSRLEMDNLNYDSKVAYNNIVAIKHKIQADINNLEVQQNKIKMLEIKAKYAKVNLDETIVRAAADGIIQNMYLSLYVPVKIHDPLFSFVDTSETFIQANFTETDLRLIKNGDKVLVFPRMYLGQKMFHGVVISTNWAVGRQETQLTSQLQKVARENEWVLLPQRFPVQIKILDLDPKFPLNVGASTYVYISRY
ncbi:MAG: HlyD family secretion protein [Neisseriaceae bacterium]|nr:MAG: HlyD family secretion protein [Neisseriaceae bacterium]